MKITEKFVADILKKDFSDDYNKVYDKSLMIQYLEKNESRSRK